MGNLGTWLKLVHILGAMAWVGGSMLMLILGIRASRGTIAERRAVAENSIVAGRVFGPAGIVVLIAGVWMVIRSPVYDFDQAFIVIGLGGIALGVVLGIAFYGPQATAWIAELDAGDVAAEARGNRIRMVAAVELIVLFTVVWAMVFKPGL